MINYKNNNINNQRVFLSLKSVKPPGQLSWESAGLPSTRSASIENPHLRMLLYISHFLRIISYRHLKTLPTNAPVLGNSRNHLSFVSLCCIQTRINEQFGLSMLLVLDIAPRSFFPGTQVFPSLQNQHLQIPITCGSRMVDEEPLSGCATSTVNCYQ